MRQPSSGGTIEEEEPEDAVHYIGRHGAHKDHAVVDAPAAQTDVDDQGGEAKVPEEHELLEEAFLLRIAPSILDVQLR